MRRRVQRALHGWAKLRAGRNAVCGVLAQVGGVSVNKETIQKISDASGVAQDLSMDKSLLDTTDWQTLEDAGNYRNLLKARTMMALGDNDPIWKAIVDAFDTKVAAQVGSIVGGS